MKLLLATFALTCSFLYIRCDAQSDSLVTRKHYPIKSCRIVFRFFNGPQRGTKTVTFNDWGNKEKEEVVTMTDTATMRKGLASLQDSLNRPDAGAFKQNVQLMAVQHNLKITVGGECYSIDLDHHIGAKSPVFLFGGNFEENMKQMGFAVVRTDTLLGKPCKVWEQHGSFRFWIWKNFYVVKKEMIQFLPDGMRMEEYATEIDESYFIKPGEFLIPDNIRFR